jgi:hypothetical protein
LSGAPPTNTSGTARVDFASRTLMPDVSALRRQPAEVDNDGVEALREAPNRHRQRRRVDDMTKLA